MILSYNWPRSFCRVENVLGSGRISKNLYKGNDFMGQPITTNPVIIMMINMIIVFSVLWGLSLVVRFIHKIDPTKKEKAILADKVCKPTQGASLLPITRDDSGKENTALPEETIAVILGALAAFGYSGQQIKVIKPVVHIGWRQAAKLDNMRQ